MGRLEETMQAYKLVREAGELSAWIRTKEQHATITDVSDDLEQVEVMQKKFDDFQADLKANEVRLAEMNEIAMQLVSLGQAEAAMKIQAQLEDLNQKWTQLEKVTKEQGDAFQKVHEVQMFHRDVDETKDWIAEKDEALNSDDIGKDMRTVQALQRKHEGLERDLAALGDKINQLDEKASKLMHTHAESSEVIYEKQKDQRGVDPPLCQVQPAQGEALGLLRPAAVPLRLPGLDVLGEQHEEPHLHGRAGH